MDTNVILRSLRSRAGVAVLMLVAAAAIFAAGTKFGEFLAVVTGTA